MYRQGCAFRFRPGLRMMLVAVLLVWVAPAQGEWYWKDYNGPNVAGGFMPDFDQNQDFNGDGVVDKNYCGPTAVANSLWWFDQFYGPGAVVPAGWTPQQLIEDLATRMGTNDGAAHPSPSGRVGPYTGTYVDDMQLGIDSYLTAHDNSVPGLFEHTVKEPTFQYVEREVERSQDVTLLLGFYHIEEVRPGPGGWEVRWERRGGHYVTVAGVDSAGLQIAFSDPDADRAEVVAGAGVVRGVNHVHPAGHNDGVSASHDIYNVRPSFSPGGNWLITPQTGDPLYYAELLESRHLEDAGGTFTPEPMWTFVGDDFLSQYDYPIPQVCQTYTEVEYAVIVSPVPEPVTGLLLLVGWGWCRRRR